MFGRRHFKVHFCRVKLNKPDVFLWGIGKQYIHRSDAIARGVWSGSPLLDNIISIQNEMEVKIISDTPKGRHAHF